MKWIIQEKKMKEILLFSFLFLFMLSMNMEQAKAQTSSIWNAPQWAQQLKNPVPAITDLKNVKMLYLSNCAPCHGSSGKGDGIAAAALHPKPADHTSAAVQKETDGSLYWKISQGHSPMPSYKQALSDVQRWQLVNYIRTLARHK